ncbi:hypothetical protein FM071_04965 [Sulfurimonas paralvinellae]|uniref:Rod shape-determining protein MreD n=1 Tax=Sulfurimonas paralvinellae TaxID=317658 RepID=A0A7M1B7K3_9BACT|nr:hypothetical protein FM071_04965 [Sulfurimonas paralvinellae]
MQRSISDQKPIVPFFYIVLYIIYSSIGSIYPFLPPLLSVLFVLFSRALNRGDSIAVLFISFCLLVFEANYGYLLFSSIIYFYIQHKFIMPKINQNFSCNFCIKISYVLFTYLGYFAFLTLVSNIFLLEAPELNYYIVYYIVIEFFIVSLL